MIKHVLYTMLFFLSFAANAQFASLSGSIKDQYGSPIPGAGIYISGYKAATVSDDDGMFKFPALTAGNYNILIQAMGFLPEKVNIDIQKENVSLTVRLKESTTNIKQVVIMPSAKRESYLALFKEYFIGKTTNSSSCKILNPDVLIVDYNSEDKLLTVTSDEMLEVENEALGYKIKYLLARFEYNFSTRVIYYEGYPNFEEMEGSEKLQKKWARARESAYNGSLQHFYRSLYTGTTVQEGFVINKLERRLKTQGSFTINGKKMISAPKEPEYETIIEKDGIKLDSLVLNFNDDLKYLNTKANLYVMFKGEVEVQNYITTGYRLARPHDYGSNQISSILIMKEPVTFYRNGSIADPSSVLYNGYWAYEKIADQVPFDYVSIKQKQLK